MCTCSWLIMPCGLHVMLMSRIAKREVLCSIVTGSLGVVLIPQSKGDDLVVLLVIVAPSTFAFWSCNIC
jgi:hypothetical protein